MSVDEILNAQRLPDLQKFWQAVWVEEKLIEKEQVMDGNVFHYLDFEEHFDAVQLFCHPVADKLCIHQEYLDAFKRFEDDSGTYGKGACIIGQPGIGKTCFIAYAVIELMRKKRPVAVEVTFWEKPIERYLLFSAEGVTLHRGIDTNALKRHRGIWAFSDSDERILIPAAAFTDTRGVRTFQVTSPKKDRYQEWTKQKNVSHYIMNIPSEKDIRHLSLVLGKDIAAMQSLAAKWGNVPRTLLALYNDFDAQHSRERLVRQQVDKGTEDMSRILSALNTLDTTGIDGPSAIYFIQPFLTEDGTINRRDHCILIPTSWLRDQVADGLLRREEGERAKLFKLLTGSARTRTSAGNVFESIVHKFLSGGTTLHVRWHKTPVYSEPTLTLSLPALRTWPANVDLKAVDTPFFYWRPESLSFTTIDGAIFAADCIYLIQATIAMTHSFKKKGIDKFHEVLPDDRKALPKKFLVVGHTKRQTEAVTQNLISEMKKVNMDLDVGSITIDIDADFRETVNENTS